MSVINGQCLQPTNPTKACPKIMTPGKDKYQDFMRPYLFDLTLLGPDRPYFCRLQIKMIMTSYNKRRQSHVHNRVLRKSFIMACLAWLSVSVKSIVQKFKIVKCNWEDPFGQLFEATASKFETSTVQKVLISKNDRFVESHEVPIDAPLSTVWL